MVSKQNFCNHCPQGCISCGLNKTVRVIECDTCGTEAIDGETMYRYNGEDYCFDCLWEQFLKEHGYDLTSGAIEDDLTDEHLLEWEDFLFECKYPVDN